MKRIWCPRCHQLMYFHIPLRGLAFGQCSNRTCKLPSIQSGSPAMKSLLAGSLSPNFKISPFKIAGDTEVQENV